MAGDSMWEGAGQGTRRISPALSGHPRTDPSPGPRRPTPRAPQQVGPSLENRSWHSCESGGREPKCRAQLEPKLHRFTSFTNSISTGCGKATLREPLLHAPRKANFTLLPCSPAKINTISFKFIGPEGLIPQRSLSTKYYYYPNCLSWVIFLFEKSA